MANDQKAKTRENTEDAAAARDSQMKEVGRADHKQLAVAKACDSQPHVEERENQHKVVR